MLINTCTAAQSASRIAKCMQLVSFVILAGVARGNSVAFSSTIDQLQQCQGLVLGQHAVEGCTTSIESSFSALAAAVRGRPISQDMASALVHACTSRQTPHKCMADLVLTAAASTGPHMQNQDTNALLTAMDAMCMGDSQRPCFLEAASALEGVNWADGPDAMPASACKKLASAGRCAGEVVRALEPLARGAVPAMGAALHALPSTCARLGIRLPMDADTTAAQVAADEAAEGVPAQDDGWVAACPAQPASLNTQACPNDATEMMCMLLAPAITPEAPPTPPPQDEHMVTAAPDSIQLSWTAVVVTLVLGGIAAMVAVPGPGPQVQLLTDSTVHLPSRKSSALVGRVKSSPALVPSPGAKGSTNDTTRGPHTFAAPASGPSVSHVAEIVADTTAAPSGTFIGAFRPEDE